MRNTTPMDITYIRECLEPNEDSPSGLIWKERPVGHFVSEGHSKMWNQRFAGTVAGSKRATGLGWKVRISGKWFEGRRLVNAIITGVDSGVSVEDATYVHLGVIGRHGQWTARVTKGGVTYTSPPVPNHSVAIRMAGAIAHVLFGVYACATYAQPTSAEREWAERLILKASANQPTNKELS
jgi:hypothetical protein